MDFTNKLIIFYHEKDTKVIISVDGVETENYYYTWKRYRGRECNTFDDQCLTEPGLKRSFYEEQVCVHWQAWGSWSRLGLLLIIINYY